MSNSMPIQKINEPILKRRDIILSTICTIFFLDTVGPVAAMGTSAITWSLLVALILFIPSGLIMAEMGSSYPANGGMYIWSKLAFGSLWGARMTWYYWFHNTIWHSSVAIFLVSVLCQVFLGDIPFMYELVLTIIVIWIMVFLALRPLHSAKHLINFAAIMKIVIACGMVCMAVIFLIKGNVPANRFMVKDFIPHINDTFLYLGALVYNFMGFEIMSSAGDHIKDPQKNVPRATIANAVLITVMYLITVTAVIIIIPIDDISIIGAIMDCFLVVDYSALTGKVITFVIGAIFICILFVQASLWITGTGRVMARVSEDGEVPAILGKKREGDGTPIGATVISGLIATTLTVLYGFLASNAEDMFWKLFSFTNVIFLIPYIINFQAFIKLRKKNGKIDGAYHVPGPNIIAMALARLGQIILISTILIIIFAPGSSFDLASSLILLLGSVVVAVLGEVVIRFTRRHQVASDGRQKSEKIME